MTAFPVKVLMITGRADPGGGPEHLLQLSRQLVGECDVYIASPREQPYWERFVALVGLDHMIEIPHRRFSWSETWTLADLVRAKDIEVIHSHGRAAGLYGRIAAAASRRPVVHTPHGPLIFGSLKSPAFWAGDFTMSLWTDRIIAVSASEKRILQRQLLRWNGMTEITNGVQIPSEPVAPEIFAQKPFRIVHVTRFVTQKNSEMVLDILDEVRKKGALNLFKVDMLGDGPGRAELEQQAAQRGLSESLVFHGARPAIQPYLKNASVFLTTSRWEGLPLAVLEAMAMAVPVVASATPGNVDVVDHDVGRLFNLNDPATAADHLIELAQNAAVLKQLSERSRARIVREFSVDRMARDTLAVYRSVIRSSKSEKQVA